MDDEQVLAEGFAILPLSAIRVLLGLAIGWVLCAGGPDQFHIPATRDPGGFLFGAGFVAFHVGWLPALIFSVAASSVRVRFARRMAIAAGLALTCAVPTFLMPYLMFAKPDWINARVATIWAGYGILLVALVVVFGRNHLRRQ
jgi:hypothetical protein